MTQTIGTFTLSFEAATVANCNYIGKTVSGIQAVVRQGDVIVFRSQPSTKRFIPRQQAMEFIGGQQ